jgi:hypothetical protein
VALSVSGMICGIPRMELLLMGGLLVKTGIGLCKYRLGRWIGRLSRLDVDSVLRYHLE